MTLRGVEFRVRAVDKQCLWCVLLRKARAASLTFDTALRRFILSQWLGVVVLKEEKVDKDRGRKQVRL